MSHCRIPKHSEHKPCRFLPLTSNVKGKNLPFEPFRVKTGDVEERSVEVKGKNLPFDPFRVNIGGVEERSGRGRWRRNWKGTKWNVISDVSAINKK